MSEAFDNVGVMMLLHQKMMRDAEVATAYQLMLANPEEEEPPKKKRKHNWWRNLARAITFQWIPIGGLFAPKGDMFAPFGATWRTLGADCSMQVARQKFQTF